MLKPSLPRQQKLHRHHGLQDLQANPERANRPSIQSRFNQVKDFFNSLKSIPPYLRKITKMVNNSNDQQRRTSASIFCEDPFSSSTPYAEELEYNIDFLPWLFPLSDLQLDFDSFVSYVVLRLARSLLHNTNTKSAFSNTNTSIN